MPPCDISASNSVAVSREGRPSGTIFVGGLAGTCRGFFTSIDTGGWAAGSGSRAASVVIIITKNNVKQ